jgi:hypothetical protein
MINTEVPEEMLATRRNDIGARDGTRRPWAPYRNALFGLAWFRNMAEIWRPGAGFGGGEQVHPFVFAVPAFGQVQRNVPTAIPGGAGRQVDQSRRMVTPRALA